jgi:hypothetical protein
VPVTSGDRQDVLPIRTADPLVVVQGHGHGKGGWRSVRQAHRAGHVGVGGDRVKVLLLVLQPQVVLIVDQLGRKL